MSPCTLPFEFSSVLHPSSQNLHPQLKYIKNLVYFFDCWLIFDLYSECPWARPQAVMTKFTGGAGYVEVFLKILHCEEALCGSIFIVVKVILQVFTLIAASA